MLIFRQRKPISNFTMAILSRSCHLPNICFGKLFHRAASLATIQVFCANLVRRTDSKAFESCFKYFLYIMSMVMFKLAFFLGKYWHSLTEQIALLLVEIYKKKYFWECAVSHYKVITFLSCNIFFKSRRINYWNIW